MLQNNVAPKIGQKLPNHQRPIILGAGLHKTCRGERALVVIRFDATFLPLRLYCEKNVYLFHERCRKSNNMWFRALMQSAGRDEVRWSPGQQKSLAPSCSNQRCFGSKSAVEESTCDIVRTFRRLRNDRRPGNCAPLAPLVVPLAVRLFVFVLVL